MRGLLLVSACVLLLVCAAPAKPSTEAPPWLYTKRLAKKWYGWTGDQWLALNEIVKRESGWDYCAHYPSTHDCFYAGSNACGIPQAYYCPEEWRGHLYLWHRQVFWTLRYIRGRYGTPVHALWHETHGGY